VCSIKSRKQGRLHHESNNNIIGHVGQDIRTQTRQALNNLRAVLAAAGSSLEQTLRVNVYLRNPEDFPAMNEVYQEFFRGHKPARTTVPGVEWGKGVLIEVDAIALRAAD
jgi:2-iminobutanoate/2-iminopropanoate deaminase